MTILKLALLMAILTALFHFTSKAVTLLKETVNDDFKDKLLAITACFYAFCAVLSGYYLVELIGSF